MRYASLRIYNILILPLSLQNCQFGTFASGTQLILAKLPVIEKTVAI